MAHCWDRTARLKTKYRKLLRPIRPVFITKETYFLWLLETMWFVSLSQDFYIHASQHEAQEWKLGPWALNLFWIKVLLMVSFPQWTCKPFAHKCKTFMLPTTSPQGINVGNVCGMTHWNVKMNRSFWGCQPTMRREIWYRPSTKWNSIHLY